MAHVGMVGFVCIVLFLSLPTSVADNDDHGADAVSYSKGSFESAIPQKKHFVMFFAPWCGHCKRLAPTWNELAKIYNNDESAVTVAKVDCTEETALCAENDISGYPTLKFFHKKKEDPVRYKNGRDLDSLRKFVEAEVSKPDNEEETKAEELIELTEDTFKSFTQRGFHFVKFYAPWCGHCKRLAPTWEDLWKSFADNKEVAISKVDCTVSNAVCNEMGVRSYPTLLWFKDGEKVEQYQGGRSHKELMSFVTDKMEEAAGAPHGTEEEKIPEDAKEDGVLDLKEGSFKETIESGLTFVKFFAPWCGHCKKLAPTWDELGTKNVDKAVKIARVDCTQEKSICDEQKVKGYPTLVIFRNGLLLEEYEGGRALDNLQKFVDKHLAHEEL